MIKPWAAHWQHVFKLDPNRDLSDEALEGICQSGTDAIIIGGTDGVTYQNTRDLLERVKKYSVFCVQEISGIDSVVPGFDAYLIPTVLNTSQSKFIHGLHFNAVKQYGSLIPWNRLLLLGYVILNPDAKVSRVTQAHTDLDQSDCIAYARLVEHLFEFPVLYVEYSGRFGDPEKVAAIKRELTRTHLFYGGGIQNEQQAKMMAQIADTVVVGNLVYEQVAQAVQTVKWVKEAKASMEKKG